MHQILIIEDDPGIGLGLILNLQYEGYTVSCARTLKDARVLCNEKSFSLILLDVGLPDGDGIEFCGDLRALGSRTPVIILTAKTDEDSVVKGLAAGANDYVRKPFGNRELLARVKTVLREPLLRDDQIRFEDLLILREQRKILVADHEIDFSPREFQILLFLTENADCVVTRERLMEKIDRHGEISDRTLDSHLSHIRSKLSHSHAHIKITPIYGVGYRLGAA